MTRVEEKKVVLVVDDAPANIQVVNSILRADYKIRIATSGAKALELLRNAPMPDLILLDVMMPEMDGYEVCAQMKSSPETRDIPVIFLTGKTEAMDETRGFEAGAVDYPQAILSYCGEGTSAYSTHPSRSSGTAGPTTSSYQPRTGDGEANSAVHPSERNSQD